MPSGFILASEIEEPNLPLSLLQKQRAQCLWDKDGTEETKVNVSKVGKNKPELNPLE